MNSSSHNPILIEVKALIEGLIEEGVLKTPEIIEAFRNVDRADFVLEKDRARAHEDLALDIGFGKTISQPSVVALMLELLGPRKGDRILDVGSGSGWTTALLAAIVGSHGRVYGVEIDPHLVRFGQGNLAKYFSPWAQIFYAGRVLGFPAEAPFKKILVSATSETISRELADQLENTGTMVVPIGGSIWQIRKYDGYAFVPLIYRTSDPGFNPDASLGA